MRNSLSQVISSYYSQSLRTAGFLLIGAASLKGAPGTPFRTSGNDIYPGYGNAYLGFRGDFDNRSAIFTHDRVSLRRSLTIGHTGDALLELNSGSRLKVRRDLTLGNSSGAEGYISVDDSKLLVGRDAILGKNGFGKLSVTGNSKVFIGDDLYLGFGRSSEGTLSIQGRRADVFVRDELVIGRKGDGEVKISWGGDLTVGDDLTLGEDRGSSGKLTISGRGSDLKVGEDLVIGDNGNGLLMVSRGAEVNVNEDLIIGDSSRGRGALIASGRGTEVNVGENLEVGDDGRGFALINDGAELNVGGHLSIGDDASGKGLMVLSGKRTDAYVGDSVYVGYEGEGNLIVADGADLNVGSNLLIGELEGSKGTMIVTGRRTDVNVDNSLSLGYEGDATLTVSKGADVHVGSSLYMGSYSTATGVLNIRDKSTHVNIGESAYIGEDGEGTVNVSGGARLDVENDIILGRFTTGSGTLDISGKFTRVDIDDDDLIIGQAGTGTVNVSGGARLDVEDNIILGAEATGSGTLNISGRGTRVDIDDEDLIIGQAGTGTVNVSGGSRLDVDEDIILGAEATGSGTLNISGRGTRVDIDDDDLIIGQNGSGLVNVSQGARLTVDDDVVVGKYAGSEGTFNVYGRKTKVSIDDDLYVGEAGNGKMTVSHGAFVDVENDLIVGDEDGGTGLLTIKKGAKVKVGDTLTVGDESGATGTIVISRGGDLVVDEYTTIGTEEGAQGKITVTGSKSDLYLKSELYVGSQGSGVLEVKDGAEARVNDDVYLGYYGTGKGEILVDGEGSYFIARDSVYAGNFGEGSITVQNGGEFVVNDDLYLAHGGFYVRGMFEPTVSKGTLTVKDQSTLTVKRKAYIGSVGSAAASIESGSSASFLDLVIGEEGSSEGSLSIKGLGTQVFVSDDLDVGNYGSGTLSIADGAVLTIGDDLNLAIQSDSSAKFNAQGAGTQVSIAERLNVGWRSAANASISAGASVQADELYAAILEGSTGNITFTGAGTQGTFREALIGIEGAAKLAVLNGAQLRISENFSSGLSDSASAQIKVSGTGANLQVAGDANLSSSTVTVANGGQFLTQGSTNLSTRTDSETRSSLTITGAGSVFKSDLGFVVNNADVVVQNGGKLTTVPETFSRLYLNGNSTLGIKGDSNKPGEAFGVVDFYEIFSEGSIDGTEVPTVYFDHKGTLENPYVMTYDKWFDEPEKGAGTFYGHTIYLSGDLKLESRKGASVIIAPQYYTGGTTINGGRLITGAKGALSTGAVQLNSGILQVGYFEPVGTYHHLDTTLEVSELNWKNGQVYLTPGKDSKLNVTGTLSNQGDAGEFLISYRDLSKASYELVTFGSSDLAQDSLSAAFLHTTGYVDYDHTLELRDNSIWLTIHGAKAWGKILDNKGTSNVPTFADFMVSGDVIGRTDEPIIRVQSLIFEDQSSLELFDKLFVTNGLFEVKGEAVVHGDQITTTGSFVQTGNGALNYLSNLFVNGTATFKEGRAYINGELVADLVQIAQGFTFGGSGFVYSDLINDGTVAPGNSPGTLTISGDYTQTSNGNLDIEIGGNSWFDRLIVGGTARLDGDLNVFNFAGNKLEAGDKFRIIEAGRVRGEFDDINVAQDNVRGRVRYANDKATLYIAAEKYSDAAKGTNQRNLARTLDRWIGVENGAVGDATWLLDAMNEGELRQTFDALAPTYVEAALSSAIELSQGHGDLLHQHLSARRLAKPSQAAAPAATGKDAKSVQAPEVAPATSTQWNAWTQVSGTFSEGGMSLAPNEDFESGSVLLGADYALSDTVSVGVFASYQEARGDYSGNDSVDSNAVRLGFYSTLDLGGFYANAAAGYGRLDYDFNRDIRFSGFKKSANGSAEGDEFFGLVGAGYDVKVNQWTFGPQASLQYSHVSLDSFRENGAGVFGLSVDDAEADSLRSQFGARVAYNWEVKEGLSIIPEVRAFWQHEFLNGSENIKAALNGGRGASFTHQTQARDKDSVFVGAGVGVKVSDRFYGNVYYNTDLGRGDSSHTLSVSATYKF